ncbi:hypothetical protein LWI29_012477 [Acer saccharum]|uniref:HVA22-like protein n=1 Tax=Acer saccharum TaxID=4024 RepID=A0AA39S4X0_ACESA|nr:hypothetical protein LWI29_012477 [Acer saccharum]
MNVIHRKEFASKSPQSQKEKVPLQCSHCDQDYHTIDKCYYLHGFPPGHKFHGKNMKPPNKRRSAANHAKADVENSKSPSTSQNDSPTFTKEEYNQIMAMLKRSNGNPQHLANVTAIENPSPHPTPPPPPPPRQSERITKPSVRLHDYHVYHAQHLAASATSSTSGTRLVFGYAYPAFECFKVVEKNKADIEQLRFWCQYWILVAILSVGERISDIFISWLPMYGEAKLALFIYLWYPKTKGTAYIYETFVRPYISQYETEIDRQILELRARSWDLAIYYWQNFAHLGQAKFFEILHYVAGQSTRLNNNFSSQMPSNEKVQYSQGMPPNGVNVQNPIPEPTSPVSPREKLLQTRQRLRRQASNQ